MKKTALALALALALGISTAAAAGTTQCKSTQGQAFTMEVPDGWASKDVPGGCAAAKTDGSEFISVAYYPANGLNAKAFAAQFGG